MPTGASGRIFRSTGRPGATPRSWWAVATSAAAPRARRRSMRSAITASIAPSSGHMFAGNAAQNGLLTASVSDDAAAALMGLLDETPGQPLTVDLEQQTIQYGDESFRFAIDPVRRTRLLNGWDNIALTESYMDKIAAFKVADRARRPWAAPAEPR